MNKDLKEPLTEGEGLKYSVKDLTYHPPLHPQCSELFVSENIINYVEGQKVGISLHDYWVTMGGPQGLAQGLQTNLKAGIEGDPKDVEIRALKYGKNVKRMPRIKTLCELIGENFQDFILQILLLAATVSLIIGIIENGLKHGWIEGLSIYIAVIIIVTVTSGNNYLKEKQFQQLVCRFFEDSVAVYRGANGDTTTVSSTELVVGDVVKLETGMRVPADCLLIEGTDLACDESALTGEPEQVDKNHVTSDNYPYNPCPFLLAKTLVVQGQGTAMVLCVGPNTRSGAAEEKLNIEDEETPLQSKLDTIAAQIGKIGVYVSILTFIAMTLNLVITTMLDDKSNLFSLETLSALVSFLIIAITVIVVAVPEGLPLAVTIALAFSVAKMRQENNLVKKLQASETMGGANEICTDKTGTLTMNQMTVMKFYSQDKVYDVADVSDLKSDMSTGQMMTEGVLYNCSARVEKYDDVVKTMGNSTEQGLLKFLMSKQVDAFNEIRKKDGNIVVGIPFNSKRKRACTAVKHPDDPNLVRVFLKGAPEIVMDYCTKYYNADGNVEQLSESKKNQIIHEVVQQNFAAAALRTILIAYTDYSVAEYEAMMKANNNFQKEEDREVLENEMTVICIYALIDPLRPEIIESVNKCYRAGITIRMVTGDNIDTAKAISLEAGILKPEEADQEYACMEGKVFREVCGGLKKIPGVNDDGLLREEIGNKQAFRAVVKRLRVLARSTPEDKYMLVTGLKEMEHVVAVTGDGTNDAPALKKADVGFAMGITGTDVAKDACDIVLLDDNFASIVTAAKWGRNIYTNVRKFLQFQLTVNVVAMFIVFIGGAVITDPPLTSVQMLWVNLIMDTFAALALATEPPSDTLLEQAPQSRTEKIVTAIMWRNIIGQAIYQAVVLLVMLFAGKQIFGFEYDSSETGNDSFWYPDNVYDDAGNLIHAENDPTQKCVHFTMVFDAFVFMQVFNEINSRKLGEYEYNVFKGFFNNFLFIFIILLTIAMQVVLVTYGGMALRCAPLTWEQHLICVAIGAFSLVNGVIVKLFLPARWFDRLQISEEKMSDEEEQQAFTSTFRKSFRQSTTRNRMSEKIEDNFRNKIMMEMNVQKELAAAQENEGNNKIQQE